MITGQGLGCSGFHLGGVLLVKVPHVQVRSVDSE